LGKVSDYPYHIPIGWVGPSMMKTSEAQHMHSLHKYGNGIVTDEYYDKRTKITIL